METAPLTSPVPSADKVPCSVGMLTFNSARVLRRALESVKDFDDIILCDGGSTDETTRIAEEYGTRVILQDAEYKMPGGNRLINMGGARAQMIEAAKNEWFLMIDSDESISPGLHDDIARIARAPYRAGDPLAYRIPIRFFFAGRLIKHSSNYPGYQPRLFSKKSGGRYTRVMHNRMEFNAGVPIGTLAYPWYVYLEREDIGIFRAERGWYRRVEVEEACKRTLPDFMRYVVFWHLKAAAGIAGRSLYLYLRYGFKDTMPLQVEIGRTLGPLILILKATLCRTQK
ncbi:glycosyltransferase family 2 protein [Candidatus Kaiserbacteria bacterium]|nr:glycosyltransferase family 2 protein [Candidatus Kaiserbacteria bacterium]